MSAHAPSVSIVMPVHQAERFLAEALASLLAQSYPDFELIAVDDGSSDASGEILEDFAKRDARVQVVRQPHAGVIRARNTGLRRARAELVACMDADDVSLPDRLARQVSALAERPAVICLGGGFEVIDAQGRRLDRVQPPSEHAEIVAQALRGRSPICGSNAMFRRSVVLAAGGYDEAAACVEDLELWLRLAERGLLANLPDVISRVRFHDASQSAREQERQLAAIERVVNLARERRGIEGRIPRPPAWRPLATPQSQRAFAAAWARSAWRLGERRTALVYALRALRSRAQAGPIWRGLRDLGRRLARPTCPR